MDAQPVAATNQEKVMQSVKRLDNAHCAHKVLKEPSGLALITIGNSLRGDDGLASVLCNMLPESALKDVCRFELGTYTGFLSDCLSGHRAAIVIDSTQNGTAPGSVSIMDLGAMSERATIMNIGSCHGFSLAGELRIAKQDRTLPKRVVFIGVEVDDVDWTENLSRTLEVKLPHLARNLSLLVTTVLETLRRDA
jgi:hydrogenase maturation protease